MMRPPRGNIAISHLGLRTWDPWTNGLRQRPGRRMAERLPSAAVDQDAAAQQVTASTLKAAGGIYDALKREESRVRAAVRLNRNNNTNELEGGLQDIQRHRVGRHQTTVITRLAGEGERGAGVVDVNFVFDSSSENSTDSDALNPSTRNLSELSDLRWAQDNLGGFLQDAESAGQQRSPRQSGRIIQDPRRSSWLSSGRSSGRSSGKGSRKSIQSRKLSAENFDDFNTIKDPEEGSCGSGGSDESGSGGGGIPSAPKNMEHPNGKVWDWESLKGNTPPEENELYDAPVGLDCSEEEGEHTSEDQEGEAGNDSPAEGDDGLDDDGGSFHDEKKSLSKKKQISISHLQKDGVMIGCMNVFADVTKKEFVVLLTDKMVEAFLVEPSQFRAIARRTGCEIEVTRRILNRRLGVGRWVKYLVLTIKGPSLMAIDQCDKLMIKVFPPYKIRKEYIESAHVALFVKESFPDNSKLYFNFQRTGPTRTKLGEMRLQTPFDSCAIRPLENTPWKYADWRLRNGMLEPRNMAAKIVIPHVYPEWGSETSNFMDSTQKWEQAGDAAIEMEKKKSLERSMRVKNRKTDAEPLFAGEN